MIVAIFATLFRKINIVPLVLCAMACYGCEFVDLRGIYANAGKGEDPIVAHCDDSDNN